MTTAATLPKVGDVGRVHQPGAKGAWPREYVVKKVTSPVTVLDDLAGDRTRGPCLQLESVDRVPNGDHDPSVAGQDHPAESASVPWHWFVPGPAASEK
jgi:hypothetical protein